MKFNFKLMKKKHYIIVIVSFVIALFTYNFFFGYDIKYKIER